VRPAHPAANAFPLMSGDEFEAFVANFKANGYDDQAPPVIFHKDGSVIDGRNRLRACEAAGIQPRFIVYEGPDDQVPELVRTLNLHRRHLSTTAQRAMAAARIKPAFEAEARERMLAGHPSADLHQGRQGRAAERAAEAVGGVSPRAVAYAEKVLKSGNAKLIEAVESGRVGVTSAVDRIEARQPKPERQPKAALPPSRHPVHGRAHHRNQSAEMDRAAVQLTAVVRAIAALDAAALDTARMPDWLNSLKTARTQLGQAIRRLSE
jgi:hypothetical protein